ncbi:ribokinase [Shewanella colwelliana]|uniref:ribokinase n=1 Tax=Shewanella colwelliana TaxID=23 RepID=UPI00048F69D9|nr:ribokinase [Shewanella colwelliana]
MSRLLIVGSANADHVMNFEFLPAAGQTLMSQNYRLEHGGKGANQAVAVARLCQEHTRVDFICHVGDDTIGDALSNAWLSDGICEDGVTKKAGQATGTAMIFVGKNGENMIGVSAGANASLTPEALGYHQHLLRKADWLLVQLETPGPTVLSALTLAKENGTNTILNPAPASVIGKDLLRLVDIITPNETEAEAITGIEVTDASSAKLAAQMLHQLGPKTVIITLGKQGAYLSHDGFEGIIPGIAVDPVDTVAAGDTFNGGLMVALSEGLAMTDAVKFAHQAAAITVTRFGARRSIPYRHELSTASL